MISRSHLRLSLPLVAALALGGCGSEETRPEGEGGGGEGASAPAVTLADSYAGTWTDARGAAFAVEDDGSSTVVGTLDGADPAGRWETARLEVSRGRDGLKGTLMFTSASGSEGRLRLELLPAGGNLAGRVQSAWLDEDGSVLTFPGNPDWRPVEFTVALAQPVVEPSPEPAPSPEPVEEPGPEQVPGEEPGAVDEPPPVDEPTPVEEAPALPPVPTDPGEEEGPMTLGSGDEASQQAAEEQLQQEQAQAQEAEALRQRRADPEGLARTLFEAVQQRDARLYAKCWISKGDARFYSGAREGETLALAKRSRDQAWSKLRRLEDLNGAEFVRLERTIERGAKTQEIRDGLLVYRSGGEEHTIRLSHLIRVNDESWKVLELDP